ncbi:phosphopantetheine-binding protein [Micromonospora sp. KLBMP9576]|uniref:phosphopantetheine-binding protein n=1 Tax=Micromonospora sp. KLBMP9576 TaxID=3424769 RepID=UPI003D917EA0
MSRADEGRGAAPDPVETVAALRDIPEVRDALVVDRAGPDGVPVAVGYVTGPDPSLGTGRLRQQLLSQLPRDMVPRHFVVLDEFPLTPAGEYDLAALPDPDPQTAPVLGHVEPSKPMEIKLAGWFRQVLGVDRVGIHDSFFALGGSSLQATVLTSRIFDEFDINLSLQDMFANATVAELSDIVIRTLGERTSTEKIKARRRSLKGMGLAIHGKLPLPLRRVIPPGVPCGGSPGDGKRRAPADQGPSDSASK